MLKRVSRQWLAVGCLALLTTACGGGGGGGGGSDNPSSSPSPTPSSSPSASPSPAPTPSTARSVTLSWTIPTTRADGSALAASAIAGYRLFYTRDDSAPSEDTLVTISGGTTTNTRVSLTSAGTYTFAITAVDLNGVESALSAPATITLQ